LTRHLRKVQHANPDVLVANAALVILEETGELPADLPADR